MILHSVTPNGCLFLFLLKRKKIFLSANWFSPMRLKIYSCFSRLTAEVFCLQFIFFPIFDKIGPALSEFKGYFFANALFSDIEDPIVIKGPRTVIRLPADNDKLHVIKIRFHMDLFKQRLRGNTFVLYGKRCK